MGSYSGGKPHSCDSLHSNGKRDTVIFDLDGTLLNTLDDLNASVNYALGTLGFPHRNADETLNFVGNGAAKLIALSFPKDTEDSVLDQGLELFNAHYLNHMNDKTTAYPGIVQLLDRLVEGGYKLAVVSNKPDTAVGGLCRGFFGNRICRAYGERAGVPKKPAPDTVLYAISELGSTPERSVYIGDSEVDLATARNAALPCIAVSWGFRSAALLKSHGAVHIADSPDQIDPILQQL